MSSRTLVLLIVSACGGAAPHQQPPPSSALPMEVTTLTDRWQQCWHFAGEEPYDDARRAELEAAMAKYCPGNEAERARLREKYRGRADVEQALGAPLDEMQ